MNFHKLYIQNNYLGKYEQQLFNIKLIKTIDFFVIGYGLRGIPNSSRAIAAPQNN